MKKNGWISILMLLVVVISGYFIFTKIGVNNQQVDYTFYNEAKSKLISQDDYNDDFLYCDVEVLLKIVNGKYEVSIIIGNAIEKLEDIDILAMSASLSAINSDDTFPSIGLLSDNSYNLVPSFYEKDNNDKSSYIMNYVSEDSVSEVMVYFSYTINNNRYFEYVKKVAKI
ncbi:MAG: hypothetical protein WC123_03285 [Bacilli bacterium]